MFKAYGRELIQKNDVARFGTNSWKISCIDTYRFSGGICILNATTGLLTSERVLLLAVRNRFATCNQ
jgi:hypothetical protein